ncbi:HK97 gp10 family phage protein [Jeotgalicoccus marinus]|uniref:HK97 gp10 family phage protein n=1 Tax=Jeotgalicoccus marinus TaxID=516700 RepID=UPI00042A85CC|nr:HK97 gp10 family phage protein [Jeotgalicoccus marinus]
MARNILARALQAFSDKTIEQTKRGVAETAQLIDTEASSRAPVDTSFLKQMIGHSIKEGGLKAEVESGASYSAYVEFGTGIFAEGPGGSRAKKIPWSYKGDDGEWYTTYGMVAQPFWFPSVDRGRLYFKNYFSN